jgi:acetyltransferase-like isoleucine patch superfamily enzyme
MSYTVGRHTYGTPLVSDWGTGQVVKIGSFCSIAQSVRIFTAGNHRMDRFSTFPFQEQLRWDAPSIHYGKGTPVIGNDVWLGWDSLILSGVNIGHGAVVGARSVVTKDVPPYAIVAGNPARIVKYRYTPEQIAALLETPWWDLPDDVIQTRILPTIPEGIAATIAELRRIHGK